MSYDSELPWYVDTPSPEGASLTHPPGAHVLVVTPKLRATGVVTSWRAGVRMVRLDKTGALLRAFVYQLYDTEDTCIHCSKERSEHLERKCLFEASEYTQEVIYEERL